MVLIFVGINKPNRKKGASRKIRFVLIVSSSLQEVNGKNYVMGYGVVSFLMFTFFDMLPIQLEFAVSILEV